MSEYMLYFWLAVICIGLVVEAVDAGTLVSIWFSLGAVVPLIMSFWHINSPYYIALQFIVFGIVTLLLIIFIRKIAKKSLLKNANSTTNLQSYIGKRFKVINRIGDMSYIKINGIEYAVLDEDDMIDKGDMIEILGYRGNKVVVNKIKEKL